MPHSNLLSLWFIISQTDRFLVAVTIALLREALLANAALKWTIASMRANMIQYVANFVELFFAGETLEDLILLACFLADSVILSVSSVYWL